MRQRHEQKDVFKVEAKLLRNNFNSFHSLARLLIQE